MTSSTPFDFRESTLFISLRSPFARRIRVALHENGVSFTEKVYDVFKPTPDLYEANPLGRVPTLILKNGRVMMESHNVLHCLYDSIESQFFPREQMWDILEQGALSAGVCEKCIDYYIENLRPEAHRDPEIYVEVNAALDHTLAYLEKRLERSQYVVGDQLTQADFDWGVALAYLELRYPTSNWKKRFPKAAAFSERMEARPSFQKSRPAPA